MAEWKKVIVSGSSISQLNNDANYLAEGQSNASLSGSFSGSFQGDGSLLTGVIATVENALTDGNGIADFSWDGSQPGIQVSVEVSGSTLEVGTNGVRVADGGIDTAQLAADAVDGTKIADDAVDSEHIAAGAIDFEHFSAGSVSGSVIATGGVGNANLVSSDVTIGSTSVTLGESVTEITGLTSVTSTTFVGALSGTAATASLATSVAADSVALGTDTTGNYVQSIANATNGGVTITNGSTEGGDATVALNIDNLAAGAVDVGADSIAIHSSGNGTRKESVADLVTGIAGTNLSAASGQLSLSSTIANDHTFSNDVTIQGNLTIEGDTVNANVANLNVEDRFILLNSGSSTRADSGIIFGASDATANTGSALFWDSDYNSNDGRLAIGDRVAADNTANITPFYHIVGFFEGTSAEAATNQADHKGNIRLEGGEIYIYV